MTDEEVAYLAESLAASGEMIPRLPIDTTADVASTGGPTSLSTLLCPLYLRAFGYVVPKLGVPGRPAGGVDVLAQIPGYRVSLKSKEIEGVLKRCGYVHCLANDEHVPLDKELFTFRKKVGALDIPVLVVASLLAKKLAAGVDIAGLDIRVAQHGNFGKTWEEARENAKLYCRVARRLGMRPVCFLTNGSVPYQPFIGRGESLVAILQILDNRAEPWLRRHQMLCYRMSLSFLDVEQPANKNDLQLKQVFEDNLTHQGSSFVSFVERARAVLGGHTIEIKAKGEGFLRVDLDKIRSTIVSTQKKYAQHSEDFPDPCGVILSRMPGDYVLRGDILASLRVEKSELLDTVVAQTNDAFDVSMKQSIETEFEEIKHA